MIKYARLKKEKPFIKKTTRYKEESTVVIPAGTIVQVTMFGPGAPERYQTPKYRLVCGECFIHIFISDSDEWLEFLND